MPLATALVAPETDDAKYSQSEDAATAAVFGLSERHEYGSNLSVSRTVFASTPDLRAESPLAANPHLNPPRENLQTLYGSLMRLNEDEFDSELLGLKHKRRLKAPYIPGLSAVTNKATALNARLSQMMNMKAPAAGGAAPQSKYATLPVVREDGAAAAVPFAVPYDDSFDDSFVDDNNVPTSPAANDVTAESAADHSCSTSHGIAANQSQQRSASVSSQVSTTSNAAFAEPKETEITQQIPVTLLNSTILSKSSLVVSGGEGHINWNTPRSLDLSFDDLCLLLWQHRQ